MRVIRFLNDSNLLVSLGAASTCAMSSLMCREMIVITHLLNAFFLTWCAYLFIKPSSYSFQKTLITIACTGAIVNALFLQPALIWIGIAGAFLTFFYKTDWLKSSLKGYAIRRFGLLKTLATALAWTIVTTGPLFPDVETIGWNNLVYVSLSQFLMIAALALAGDLRDIAIDKGKIQSIPLRIGPMRTRVVCTIFIIAGTYAGLIATGSSYYPFIDHLYKVVFFFVPAHGVILISIFFISPSRNWHLSTFWLDLLLTLRLVAFIIGMMMLGDTFY